ncbi:MAG: zinc ribbon protein [Deltaproteobacteria bacterium]|nr:zinc ribbon protein [Deltaproteobacteria bacterium]
MPIYEYQCKKCEKVIERIHGMNDNPSVKCPDCGGKAARRMSSSSFHLKGSGWYVTDYGKKSKMPDKPAACPAGKEGAPACAACPSKPLPKLSSDPS